MEEFDREKAARVWQRVQNRPEPITRQRHQELYQDLRELAALYQTLTRNLSGRDGEKALRLWHQAQNAAAQLRGLGMLEGCPVHPVQPASYRGDTPGQILEKCCCLEQAVYRGCGSRSGDPDWGFAYGILAARAAERCVTGAELLGSISR